MNSPCKFQDRSDSNPFNSSSCFPSLPPSSKFPDLFMSLKVLLGFREPGLSDQLTSSVMIAAYVPKERVTADLAAEIGGSELINSSNQDPLN